MPGGGGGVSVDSTLSAAVEVGDNGGTESERIPWTRATAGIGEAGVGTETDFFGFSGVVVAFSFRDLFGVVGVRVVGTGAAGTGSTVGDDVLEGICGVCDCPDDVDGREGKDAAPGVGGRDNVGGGGAAAAANAAFRRSAARVRAFETTGGSPDAAFPFAGTRERPFVLAGRLLVMPGMGRCAGTAAAVTGVVAPFWPHDAVLGNAGACNDANK